MSTHEVFNQSTPLDGANLFATDRALRDALAHHAPALDTAPLAALGAQMGSADMRQHARLANAHGPLLHTHDAQGRRLDEVEFHPSYHALLGAALGHGLHGTPWQRGTPHAHVERLLRALRGADVAAALERELAPAHGAHAAFDRAAATLPARLDGGTAEADARTLARDVALLVQAALLRRHASEPVFGAFCTSRLAHGTDVFGTLPADTPFDSILQRALPP